MMEHKILCAGKGICQNCGEYKKDAPDNRIALCRRCHLVAHGRADKGAGVRSEHIPANAPLPGIEREEVRRQYFACFPRV